MLEDLDDPQTQARRKALEDEMRIALAHGALDGPRNVRSQKDIVERCHESWSVWKVAGARVSIGHARDAGRACGGLRDCYGSGSSSVLGKEDQVAQASFLGRAHEGRDDEISTVQLFAFGVRHDDLMLARESKGRLWGLQRRPIPGWQLETSIGFPWRRTSTSSSHRGW